MKSDPIPRTPEDLKVWLERQPVERLQGLIVRVWEKCNLQERTQLEQWIEEEWEGNYPQWAPRMEGKQ